MLARVLRADLALLCLALAASPARAQVCPPGPGSALSFDGNLDLVDCGAWPSPSNHTIEAWVRPALEMPTGYANVAGHMATCTCGRGYALRFNNGILRYNVDLASCGGAGGVISDPQSQLGVWHHYAGTYDGSTMRLYKDGELIGQTTVTWLAADHYDHFYIGAQGNCASGTSFYRGLIDEVRLWNHARTEAEIAAALSTPLTGNEPGLIGYWRLDEGSGTLAADSSPGNHDGTVVQAQWVATGTCPVVAFCAGDGSLPTLCPCSNPGLPDRGCENSAATGGARLSTTGTTSPDSLVLTSSGELATSLSIFLQGDAQASSGIVFGDGVRCVAGTLVRLYVKTAAGGTASAPIGADPSITARSGALGDPLSPGATRVYQVYYRDPDLAYCPEPPGNSFNVSNGVVVDW